VTGVDLAHREHVTGPHWSTLIFGAVAVVALVFALVVFTRPQPKPPVVRPQVDMIAPTPPPATGCPPVADRYDPASHTITAC
jgi:hypothetical protein